MHSINWNHIYTNEPANSNALVMVPMFSGLRFEGYQVVKGNWKMPERIETFNLGE